MSVIVAKALLSIEDVVAVLEDNLPNCAIEKDASEPTVRIRKTSHIGAKVSVLVHSLLFSQENLQKLRDSGFTDPVLDGLGQNPLAAPMPVAKFREYLEQTLSPTRAKDFLREHKGQIYPICAANSLITIGEWDPNEFGGLLTGGHAYHISNRIAFEKELLQLLSVKIEHSSATVPSSGSCFVATAAAGSADDSSVVALRRFRDERLVRARPGRLFIRVYGRYGPLLARMVESNKLVRTVVLVLFVRPCAHLALRVVEAKTEKRDSAK